MTRRIITIIVASLLIAGGGAFIWFHLHSDANRFDRPLMRGVGEVLAEETAKAIQDHGQIVVVISHVHRERGTPENIQWETFAAELQKHPTITIAVTQEVGPDPLEGLAGCPSAALKQIFEQHGQGDAIVFLMELPQWRWVERKVVLPSIKSKVIVLANTALMPKSQYEGYFSKGILSTLILGQWGGEGAGSIEPRNPREAFHREFRIFTAENFVSLPGE